MLKTGPHDSQIFICASLNLCTAMVFQAKYKNILSAAYFNFRPPEIGARTSWSPLLNKLEAAYHNDALSQVQIKMRSNNHY